MATKLKLFKLNSQVYPNYLADLTDLLCGNLCIINDARIGVRRRMQTDVVCEVLFP